MIRDCNKHGLIQSDSETCKSCIHYNQNTCAMISKEVLAYESPSDFSEDPAILVEEVKVDSIEEAAKNYYINSTYFREREAFILGAKSEAAKQYWLNYFKHN